MIDDLIPTDLPPEIVRHTIKGAKPRLYHLRALAGRLSYVAGQCDADKWTPIEEHPSAGLSRERALRKHGVCRVRVLNDRLTGAGPLAVAATRLEGRTSYGFFVVAEGDVLRHQGRVALFRMPEHAQAAAVLGNLARQVWRVFAIMPGARDAMAALVDDDLWADVVSNHEKLAATTGHVFNDPGPFNDFCEAIRRVHRAKVVALDCMRAGGLSYDITVPGLSAHAGPTMSAQEIIKGIWYLIGRQDYFTSSDYVPAEDGYDYPCDLPQITVRSSTTNTVLH